MFYVYDFAAFERPGHLHIGWQAIQQFRVRHSRWPQDNAMDVNEAISIAEEINNSLKSNENAFKLEQVDDEVKRMVTNIA